jgi:hypothetical protein
LSIRHVDGGCPNESTARWPIADQVIRGGARTICSPRSRERRGRELAPVQTPPRHVYYNRDLRCLSSEPVWDVSLNVHFRHGGRFAAIDPTANQAVLEREHSRCTAKPRSDRRDQWPVTMIDGLLPPAAGGVAEPGVQIGAPPPPAPAADSGVQISPRVAATPSCPLAVVTRGPY